MNIRSKLMVWGGIVSILFGAGPANLGAQEDGRPSFSGIYPHLAVSNQGRECGIGAVVVWQDRLWAITYQPHKPRGSDDKLYAIHPDLTLHPQPESVGGTHASRMIHEPSRQLIIGPYFIGRDREVRAVPPEQAPGRWTGTAEHLTDASKVLVYTMEEGLYEIDTDTLAVKTRHPDGNVSDADLLPGDHGKGAYTGQERLIVANNGQGGVLAEWDGEGTGGERGDWHVAEANKFTDVTSRGGIRGAPGPEAPVWAIGWDKRSVLLNIRDVDAGEWRRFRLPKASYAYDPSHGWFTEWPRIRDAGLGNGNLLMDMHGMFYRFPEGVSASDVGGIRPISQHLKMVVDFTAWGDELILACNDTSKMGNPLAGTAQSNFFFTSPEGLERFGKPAAAGGPWVRDDLQAGERSDPFLIEGFKHRALHLAHESDCPVSFRLEVDPTGRGDWKVWERIRVPAKGYRYKILPTKLEAGWMRLTAEGEIEKATAYFHLASGYWSRSEEAVQGLPRASSERPFSRGLIRPRGIAKGVPSMQLHFAAERVGSDGDVVEKAYYEMGESVELKRVQDSDSEAWLREEAETEKLFAVDEASVILTDAEGNRFRLPKGDEAYDAPTSSGWPRAIRETVTERSLMNIHGTFYELPHETTHGNPLQGKNFRRIKPIATHNRKIYDFCSWRGLLVLSGTLGDATGGEHYVESTDGRVGLWLGNMEDLWHFGAPRGKGGPWKNTEVTADEPSDPYLMYGYRHKELKLQHQSEGAVTFRIEVDVLGNGRWHQYKAIQVPSSKPIRYRFPDSYSAHWVRLISNESTEATAIFTYRP